MCLYTEQDEPIELTEDLIVFKWVGNIMPDSNNKLRIYSIFKSYYFGYYNEFQKSNLKYIEVYKSSKNFTLYEVYSGFHAATSLESLKEYMLNYSKYISPLNIIECTIPAGSFIYYNETGLCVSNQIIYKKLLDKSIN
jgi:hypothetical protein